MCSHGRLSNKLRVALQNFICAWGLPGGQELDCLLSLLEVQVRSLVGELRFLKALWSSQKKIFFLNKYLSGMLKNKTNCAWLEGSTIAVTCYIVIGLGQLLGAKRGTPSRSLRLACVSSLIRVTANRSPFAGDFFPRFCF